MPVTLKIAPGFPLAAALGRDRLALADPAAVPAGKYARAALTALGVWDAVATRLAAAENVRAALLLVARGEAPLGIVYRTDALVEPGVVDRRHVSGVHASAHHLSDRADDGRVARPARSSLEFLRVARGPRGLRTAGLHGTDRD